MSTRRWECEGRITPSGFCEQGPHYTGKSGVYRYAVEGIWCLFPGREVDLVRQLAEQPCVIVRTPRRALLLLRGGRS